MDIVDCLALLDAQIDRLERRVLQRRLRPGIESAETAELLRLHGLVAPSDCCVLYAWHDGTDASQGVILDDIHLLPGFYFTSLEDALTNFNAFRTDSRWGPTWLPVFANGGGDFLAVDCSADPSGANGRIVHFRIEESQHPVEYESVSALCRTVVQAYETGVFFLEAGQYLEMDDEEFAVVAAANNPSVAWWQ